MESSQISIGADLLDTMQGMESDHSGESLTPTSRSSKDSFRDAEDQEDGENDMDSEENVPYDEENGRDANGIVDGIVDEDSCEERESIASPVFTQSVILNKVPRFAVLTVSQPQKASDGSSSYISYLVTSQQFPGEKPERVRRRYSDFAKLYDGLCAEYPTCAIPPLPDRWRIEYIAGDRFGPEFTTKRAASLQRFLFRVSQHPYLRKSRSFLAFLSTQGGPKQAPHPASNGSADASVESPALSTALDHISEVLMNAFTKAKNQSKEMTDAKERAGRYEQNIATLDKAVVWASKTQGELALDFNNVYKQARKLAELEPQSGPEFDKLAETAKSLARATQQLRVGVDSQFACALRDMSHYVQALKGMLKQREQRQIDYEALVEYLKRSEHELVAAEHGQSPAPALSTSFFRSKMNELRGVDKEQARQQRITKLKNRISMFKEESHRAKQVSDDYEELAKREVRIFDQTEAIELQQSLAGLSNSYIDFYQTILRDFRELEASLD